MGRRRPVEVPRRRGGGARRRAARRRDRDPGLGEPRLPARRARASARGLRGGGRRQDAGRRGRGPRSTGSSASSTRSGARRPTPGSECLEWAGGTTGPGLRGAGEHPRLGGDRGGACVDLRGLGRAAARRAAPGLPRRRGGRRGRPARAPVGRAPGRAQGRRLRRDERRRRRPPRRRPSAADRGAGAHLPHARPPLRADAGGGVAGGRRRRSRTSCASGSARSATTGELPDALAAWAGTENLEERVSGADRIDPVVLEQLRAR